MGNKLPSGLPFIIGNELAERFSYYGMKSILVVFMTTMLLDNTGAPDPMSPEEAKAWFHIFSAGNYLFPIAGALLADIVWGKYKTIILLSLVYCMGHLALALDETRMGLTLGLTLIAIGSGGIKPCVSAHMGDQFSGAQATLLSKAFQWFYLSINAGAFASSLLTPILLEVYGPSIAFGIPGVAMLIATIVFWAGRKRFVVVAPVGLKKYRELFSSKPALSKLYRLAVLYALLAVFWSLFDQTGSAWVLQGGKLDTNVRLWSHQFTLLPAQMQALNPILIILFIPLFQKYVDPLLESRFGIRGVSRIALGLYLAAASFAVIGILEFLLELGHSPSLLWQAVAYALLTAGEVLASITALELAYTTAPQSMKSFVSAFYLLSVSLGNIVTACINALMLNEQVAQLIFGYRYFLFFTLLSALTGALINRVKQSF